MGRSSAYVPGGTISYTLEPLGHGHGPVSAADGVAEDGGEVQWLQSLVLRVSLVSWLLCIILFAAFLVLG